MFQKIFYPTPTDWVMLQQSRDPEYEFNGFDHVIKKNFPGEFDHMHPHLTKKGNKYSSEPSDGQLEEMEVSLPGNSSDGEDRHGPFGSEH